jgi:alkylation response protein AidB-like acyl-CoA dehydrogenase
MDVELTDEQQFLKEAVAGVLAREATFAAVRDWTESDDLSAADALAVQQGWTGIGLDEELGGQGGGVLELAIVAEQLGRGAVPWDRTLAGCLASALLASAGTDEAHALAAATADGERAAVLCVDGRAPLAAVSADAISGDRLNLEASYVLGAPRASELIVPVESGDGIELLAVSADASGVTARPRRLVDRTRALADVELADASARSLGEVERDQLATTAAAAAVLVAADALGAAGKLLDLTTQYIVERRQFGVAVGSFQAVKHAAAEMLVACEASRSAVQYAAWAVDVGAEDLAVQAAIAKAYACRAAVAVADKALFLHGAVGYTWEHDLQFPFKRAMSDELLFGGSNAHLDLIADRLELVSAGGPAPVA